MFSTAGARTCWRLKASNWRVREAARWPAFSISSACSRNGVPGGRVLFKHLAVTDDDAKQIIEIVRDTSRQAAHRFHFLGHAQLALQQPFLGDVFRENLKICGAIGRGLYEPACAASFDRRAILAFPIHLHVSEIFLVCEQFIHALTFERIHIDVCGEVQPQQFSLRFVAQHFLQRRIDEQQLSGSLRTVDAVGRIFNHRAKADFGQAQRFRGLFSRGDIAIDDDEFLRNAAGVADDAGGRLQNDPGAVLVTDAIFQVLADSRAPRFRCRRFHAFAVFRMNLIHRG